MASVPSRICKKLKTEVKNVFEATLKNRISAHFAPVTITFPIPEDQYEQAILALKKSQIGDARVYQCVEDNNIAWHCGTSGAYVHPRCRNENSIGIEVRPYKLDKSTARSAAPADWYFPPEIVDNLVVFTQMLMQKYNVPLENVVRHYDVTGKWCPRPWMGDDTNTYYGTSGNEQWKKFKERLSGEELDMNIEEARKQLTSCADTGDTPSAWARDAAEFCKRKGIFNGDGAGNYGWQQPITREAVAQILYNAFESAGMLDAIPDKK